MKRTLQLIYFCAGVAICASGCLTRRQVVTIDSQSDVVKVTQGRAVIWTTPDGGKTWVRQGKGRIPDGWMCGPGL